MKMELTSNKFMQQRFNRQKHEIESFVVRIYQHNLIKDGGIIKRKLREKLFEEIKLRRITRVKMDELGWVLMNHDLITRNESIQQHANGNRPNHFKFNMERLRNLLEQHEQNNHAELTAKKQNKFLRMQDAILQNDKVLKEIKEMVVANQPLAEIRYVTTVERMLKHNLDASLRCCFVCREYFRTADEYTSHFEKLHGEKFLIVAAVDRFQTSQKFNVLHHYNALNPVTIFTICNIYHTAMHVDCVYLYHITNQLMPINRDVWPITINPGDTYKFSVTTGMFLVPQHDYTILIHFNRILEYVEQYHFRVLKEPVELRMTHDPITLGKLNEYPPSQEMEAVFKNNFNIVEEYSLKERKLCEEIQSYMKAEMPYRLHVGNYIRILQIMNNIEDYSVQYELSRYEMTDVKFSSCGAKRFYCLMLSQFNTAPQSLIEGDYIELSHKRPNGSQKSVIGVIAQICSEKMLFETEEPIKNEVKWRLKFTPNRTSIRMEYHALEIVKRQALSTFFFPSKSVGRFLFYSRDKFQWFNSNIGTNEEQQLAVVNIVNETARPAPYILFGPPGTGKTSTLVEAISQIWKLRTKAHVLVTASSNFACNVLAERLLQVLPKGDIFRVFSKNAERLLAEMSFDLIECSNLNTGVHRLPSEEEIYDKRVVICTLTTAGRLVQASIKPNHFHYVFIDECGSATEASALVPIAGVITSPGRINGSIILSGDPNQLGPITRSKFAADMGLGVSMLERLMSLEVYKRDVGTGCYNNCMITKLLCNYRSHEAILRFSNKMFYQNELKPCCAPSSSDWVLNWSELPNPKIPIIFESTMGKLDREKDSTSYFNRKEIELVDFYLKKIISAGINDRTVVQQDIGIISPYKKQCIKLKQMCQRHGWNDIEIGSVEAFQGREKPIMLLTTVRSGTNGVGFLNNVKRLNVALTRARALLIVIGNPETLQQDVNWYEFIRYCFNEKAIRGVNFELDEERHSVQKTMVGEEYLLQLKQELFSILKGISAVEKM
ncbi:putative helicase MOV-10 [Toxorhynchites rutilus septentrionalis]|uniref:putative helicase MOV-10 n=1 Tax=Toxorhynchites rutilus septentrionalis TaxID=329112 RepID=UPI00247A728D|nr:putative helicase MOV-10 [Toxorhynchites rutilus septentrionalis]